MLLHFLRSFVPYHSQKEEKLIVNILLLAPEFYLDTLKSIQLDSGNSVYCNRVIEFTGSCSSNHNILTKIQELEWGQNVHRKKTRPSHQQWEQRVEMEEHVRRRKIRWSSVNLNNGDKYLQRTLSEVTP